ncbi:MAG: hypothetical protein K0V04_35390 [Deltaproteobacteria bacterium]|nr:hypothetical protein [Deltaproteobacteria bacterium]
METTTAMVNRSKRRLISTIVHAADTTRSAVLHMSGSTKVIMFLGQNDPLDRGAVHHAMHDVPRWGSTTHWTN